MAEKRPALGRGLSALIPEAPAGSPARAARCAGADEGHDTDRGGLGPDRAQSLSAAAELRRSEARGAGAVDSRERVDSADHREACGGAKSGARRDDGGAAARIEIIAGERRWRAAQRAGLLRVPVLVKDVPDEKLLEVALIENIQREDLNPIDEALAYRRLIDDFNLTQEALASAVGKDRSSVANFLRLLKLPDSVRKEVASGALSMGHARALLAIEQEAALERAAREVLEQEAVGPRDRGAGEEGERAGARRAGGCWRRCGSRGRGAAGRPHAEGGGDDAPVARHARPHPRKGKGGRIEIEFVSEDELHRLYEYITERR